MTTRKFVDRSPWILPAGKVTYDSETVSKRLKNYSADDVDRLPCVTEALNPKISYATEKYTNRSRKGVYTEIEPILRPLVRTKYQTLINELKETTYDSHWNKPLGRSRDAVGGLPRGLNPLETTFGVKYNKDNTIKELLNPPKTPYQVLEDSQIAHELYKKSHNDYNVGEKVCRNYLVPAFQTNKRFGMRTKYDPRGIWVKCACTWEQNEPLVFANKTQTDYVNKNRYRLGKSLYTNVTEDNIYEHQYIKKKKEDTVEDLLKDSDCPPSEEKQKLKQWLKSFNKLRLSVKNKYNSTLFINDLMKRILYYDQNKCGMVSLELFYKVCGCYGLTFDKENFEPFLHHLCLICENQIKYQDFFQLVEYKSEPLELLKIEDVPKSNQYYTTTSRASVCDYLFINNTDSEPAGISSISEDSQQECSAGLLLNPSIYSNYGLTFYDFFVPREKHVIKCLFERAGHKLDEVVFEEIWSKCSGTESACCVNAFDTELKEYYGRQKPIKVDEATC